MESNGLFYPTPSRLHVLLKDVSEIFSVPSSWLFRCCPSLEHIGASLSWWKWNITWIQTRKVGRMKQHGHVPLSQSDVRGIVSRCVVMANQLLHFLSRFATLHALNERNADALFLRPVGLLSDHEARTRSGRPLCMEECVQHDSIFGHWLSRFLPPWWR